MLALLALVLVGGSPAQDSRAPPACELSREKVLLEEAIAAVKAVDLPAGREKAAAAVAALLARSECEDDRDWQSLLHTAGLVAWDAQDPRTARTAWERILEIRVRTLPDEHPALQASRGNVAAAIRALGDLEGARALEEKVLEVRSKTLPDDHPDLQQARGNLAATIKQLGDLAGARALEEKVLEVRSRALPDDHPYLQLARTNLAVTLERLGEVARARALFEKVLEVRSRTLPEDHPDLQIARFNLAVALKDLGDLHGARALEEKVLESRTRTLPDDHPYLQEARGNLAVTIKALGDYPGARALEEKALEAFSRALPDDHPDLQMARMNLAVTYEALGDLQRARSIVEKVLEVQSRTLPEDSADLQMTRGNLAGTIKALGDFAAARELEEGVLEVLSRTLPEDHPDIQRARGNLAGTLEALGDIDGGRALEEQVILCLSRTRGKDDPDLRSAQGNLAQTIAAQRWARSRSGPEDEPDSAAEEDREEFTHLAGAFTRALSDSARLAVLTASSREAEARCAGWMPDLGRALSFAGGLGVFPVDAGLAREAFLLSEESRGAGLASAHLSGRASADPRYAEMRARMRSASDELAHLARSGASADELDAARARREEVERELAGIAGKLSGGEAGLDVDVLSARLSAREALVGYRQYPHWAHEPDAGLRPKGSQDLCAFVLRSGNRLERVELGPIAPIERAVGALRQAIGVGSGRGIVPKEAGRADDESVRVAGALVRRMIFDPLRATLEGTDRVVVALDDVLHLVPLDALPLDEADASSGPAGATLLGDRFRIETRCTLSELLWTEPALTGEGGLVALGGASFRSTPLAYSADEDAEPEEASTGATRVASLLRGGSWANGFEPLPGTGAEARGIAEMHGQAFGGKRPARVLLERKASREALAELAPGANFLHIATHGWFAPESVRSTADPEPLDKWMGGFGARMSGEERVKGMSPMLVCGLALAGAGLAEDDLARAPGLLTAEEISALDLAGCELAVLSACDTNVGERRAGQGVASLQKALHMAGARSVITSLWKVPDEATKDLMIDFYRRLWIEKKPKHQALWEAKTKLRDEKDESGKPRYTTRDWAAWVLTGDPD